jgi:hypothetical protein
MICMIKMLRDGDVLNVSRVHSEMLILQMEYLLGRKEQRTLELIINDQ